MSELDVRNAQAPATVSEDHVLALVDNGRIVLEQAVAAGDPAGVAEIQRRAEALRYLSKKAKLAIGAVNAAARLKTDAEWNAGRMIREAQEQAAYFGRGKSLPISDFSQQSLHRWQDMSR